MPKRRPSHVPLRSCAVCRTVRPKRELTRVVRMPDGGAQLDPTGRAPGRGTYVCGETACRDERKLSAAVQRALGTVNATTIVEALHAGT